MSYENIPKPVRTLLCDLCGEEIPEDSENQNRASLLTKKARVSPESKRAFLSWPPYGWKSKSKNEAQAKTEEKYRHLDFHALCIIDLVDKAIEQRMAAKKNAEEYTSILPEV